MLQGVLKFVNSFQLYIIAGLILSNTVAGVGWYVTDLKLDKAKSDMVSYVKEVEAATKEAELKAVKAKAEQEKKDVERKEAADANAAELRGKYDSILRKYAEAQRKASKPNLSSIRPTSEGSDRPGEDTVVPDALTMPYEDAEICAENTARLEAVQKWATETK